MPKHSAGILLYKKVNDVLWFFLVHPGGPFFKNKDIGAWTVPKGEYLDDEEPLVAAIREFKEETGFDIYGAFMPLNPITQKNGKIVTAWAVEGDIDASKIQSNTFTMEWPPRFGKMQTFEEIDKGEWFSYQDAVQKINPAQVGLLEELVTQLSS